MTAIQSSHSSAAPYSTARFDSAPTSVAPVAPIRSSTDPLASTLTGAPVVEIVFAAPDTDTDAIFTRQVLRITGALQRRFWSRRRTMLMDRALEASKVMTEMARPDDLAEVLDDEIAATVDLRRANAEWVDRLDAYSKLIDSLDSEDDTPIVRIRGWNETEAGILVDGCAVAGCVVDLAVAMVHSADALRAGEAAFVLDRPTALDEQEEHLWADLIKLAEDRLGVDRGTVSFSSNV